MDPLDLGVGHFAGLCDGNRQEHKRGAEERERSPGKKTSHGLTIAQTATEFRKLDVDAAV
jgi:hypothetical protein